jgi:small subunit ribosomal protein S20e
MMSFHVAVRDIMTQAQKKSVKVSGPARIPTKTLRITTRKTPCGEGSKTWDRYEMRIHKRVIDFTCSMNAMREIVSFMRFYFAASTNALHVDCHQD